jgi:Zn-dependent metalloprotease
MNYGSRLAWYVEATGPALREFIWVDAQVGVVLLNFSQIADAKSRSVYTSNHTSALPGSLLRTEGGAATGDTDADNAYDFAGITYDYYLTNHGRDSFDNAGSTIASSVHYCQTGCPFGNAFWNGSQMVYGDGFASADDVVAHELTHAITERSANLVYYVQSGALNESFSDIFGETVDLGDGVGNDASGVRWKLGEDLSIGAIRDMMTPTTFSDPGKMSDSAYFVCSNQAWTDSSADRGGVQ